MTEQQFARVIEIHNRLEALERVKREITPAYNSDTCNRSLKSGPFLNEYPAHFSVSGYSDTKIMLSYINKNNDKYGVCAPYTLRLISELLDKHDKMIQQEIEDEINYLLDEIKTL